MFKISFNFDTSAKTVTDINVIEIHPKYENINIPIIEIGDNRLIISAKALELIDAHYGDRITVNYIQYSNELTFPVIGKAEVFGDINAGNKLSKNSTVSFKGVQKTILTKFGKLFKIEPYKSGMFTMVTIDKEALIKDNLDLINE